MKIFAETAPNYWSAGFPVIPLQVKSKVPALRLGESFVPSTANPEWVEKHAEGNIGLLLGDVSGVVVLDIDVGGELSALIQSALSDSITWIRWGAKGKALGFQYEDNTPFRIYSASGKLVCELLSDRSQIVLAPSIHPTTGEPYTENFPLYEVSLKPLPDNVEQILRKVVADFECIYGEV